jgi:isoleucyl-tRNA synthetase
LPKIKDSLENENHLHVVLKVKGNKIVNLNVDGKQIELLPDEILIEVNSRENYGVESDGEFTVGLPTIISEELAEEGFCREMIHQIQNLRKEANFNIENTINTSIICSIDEKNIIEKYRDYIMKETLSKKLSFDFEDDMFIKDLKINNSVIKVGIKVIGSIV